MTKTELIERLIELEHLSRGTYLVKERAHRAADQALLDHINDPLVTEAFERIRRIYGR